jgi:hypothetical protein
MNHFDELEEGLIFPNGNHPKFINKETEFLLSNLIDLTCFHRITTRNSLNEFLLRIFISLDLPLKQYIDNYFTKNYIFQISTYNCKLKIDIELLKEIIGVSICSNVKFNYIGNTNEFLDSNGLKNWPKNLNPEVKKTIKDLDYEMIKNARTVAEFFSDKIEEHFFYSEESITQKNQFCRNKITFDCMEIKKSIIYKPLKTLSTNTICLIKKSIGEKKLNASKNFICDTTSEERLEEVIKIAYGIKNGFIDWNGYMLEYHRYVDPYYFISFTPIMDVFLNSETFMDSYHYWNMYEWIDLLPNHE